MEQAKDKHKHKNRKIGWILCLFTALLLAAVCFAYFQDYSRAGEEARKSLTEPVKEVTVSGTEGQIIVYMPTDTKNDSKGFIFYPGGKVEYLAYAPLMEELAGRGITCFLVPMPLNFALLDTDAAEKIRTEHPEIKEWYIGGHSLGGVAAAMHLKDHADAYKGVVFLASYPSTDLSGTNLRALSVFGDRDTVLNREQYEKARESFPKDFTEVVIEGGNHAGFGDYGKQEGDSEAGISPEEQRSRTAEIITEWMGK